MCFNTIMIWLHAYASDIIAFFTIILAIATISLAFVTWKYVSEVRKQTKLGNDNINIIKIEIQKELLHKEMGQLIGPIYKKFSEYSEPELIEFMSVGRADLRRYGVFDKTMHSRYETLITPYKELLEIMISNKYLADPTLRSLITDYLELYSDSAPGKVDGQAAYERFSEILTKISVKVKVRTKEIETELDNLRAELLNIEKDRDIR